MKNVIFYHLILGWSMTHECSWDSIKYSSKKNPKHLKYWTLNAWIQQRGRRNIQEPQRKTFILYLLHVLVLEEPLHTSSHAVRSCLCLYSVPYKYLSIMQLRSTIRPYRNNFLPTCASQLRGFIIRKELLNRQCQNIQHTQSRTRKETWHLQISWTTFAHRRCSLSMEGENKTSRVLLEVPLWFQALFCTILVQQGKRLPLNHRCVRSNDSSMHANMNLEHISWDGRTAKVSEWDSIKTSRPFVITHLCIV